MINKFSIKDLERLSGIKAHTIRIWEQRYNLLNPERTDTNIRYYSNDDLKLLLNVSLLNNNGVKISKIAGLSYAEITREAGEILSAHLNVSDQINTLVICTIELDEDRFEGLIEASVHQSGFEYTVLHIIYPFLDKVGMMWQTGTISPAQEHFISNLIRQKFIVAIDGQKHKAVDFKTFVLFLPEGEIHELGLLFCTYIIKKAGHKVFYLGTSISMEDLKEIYETVQPDCLLTLITHPFRELTVEDYARNLSVSFPEVEIILFGYQVLISKLASSNNIIAPASASELLNHLSKK